jgi:NAD(P)-dependent dehydrogenase (short-subunit alcohol dehydrogenase family)
MSETSAVVIGASGGIGSALARQLEAAGDHAVVHALSRSGTGLDLENEASIRDAAARIADGPPPSLVIVATGVLHGAHSPERSYRALSAEHLMRDYRLNAIGPALVAKHLLPLMPREGRSLFAALSARVGSIGDNRLGGWHAYRASKAALNILIRNLAIEHGRTHKAGIVVGLHPGTVATDLSAPFQAGVAPEKLFTPDYSAEHLLRVASGLTAADSGGIFAWDGQRIPA